MKSALLVFSAVSLFLNAQAKKRSDDADLSNLPTLVENQAATIQNLQARLDAQDARIQQQESVISSLQSTLQYHTSQISTIRSTQRKEVGFLADMNYDPKMYIDIQPGETVKFNQVISNVGRGYNNVTGIFTAPYTGLYAFYVQLVGGNHDSFTFLGIYQGNYLRAYAMSEGNAADHDDQGHVFAVFHVRQGDEISIKLTGGVGNIFGSPVTSFAGALLHAD